MARIYNSWLYENNPCQRTQPGLTKGDQKVDQSLKQWPSCGTCVGGGHSLVWPKDTKKFETVSCLRNPCQHRARRPGDKLSCRKPAGPATKQSLSGGYFLNPAILPTHGSSHYGGHPSQDISGNGSKEAGWIEPDIATRNQGYSRGNQGWMWDQGKLYKLFFLICWDSEGFVENIFKWQSPQKVEITVHHRSIYCLWRLAWLAE